MLEGASAVVALILGVLALIGVVAGLVAFARASYGKARMEALRQDNEDLRHRLDDSDEKFRTYKAESDYTIQQLTDRVSGCENENRMLREMSLQRANVELLIERVEKLVDVVVKHDKRVQEVIVPMLERLEKKP